MTNEREPLVPKAAGLVLLAVLTGPRPYGQRDRPGRFSDPAGYDATCNLLPFVGSVFRFVFFLVGVHQSVDDGEREAVDCQNAVLAAFLDG